MRPLGEIPVDSWQWLIIAAIFLLVGVRSTIKYRSTKNEITLFFAILGPLTGLVYILWAIAPMFTTSNNIIRYFEAAGDVLVAIPVAAQSYLLWLLVLRERGISKYIPIGVGAVLALLSIYTTLDTAIGDDTYAYLTDDHVLVLTKLPTYQLLMFLMFFYPIAVYFIHTAFRAKKLKERLRSLAIATLYAGLATIEIYIGTIASSGKYSDEDERAIIFSVVGVFGLLFFILAQLGYKRSRRK